MLGETLKQLREANSFTQENVSDYLGIKRSAYSNYEMGIREVPLMVLEKRPWFFGSYLSIVLVGLLSGAVFASVENALYFFVYIPSEKLTQGTILWRLVVCTAMHVGCAALACSGLARAWSRARERLAEFEMSVAMPRLIAAVVIHGIYNLCALIFAILSR